MTICPECGYDRPDIVGETVTETDTETVTEAAVEIAKVEAERDVTLAKIASKNDEGWQEARIIELEGRLSGITELLDRIAPRDAPEESESEPVPIIVEPPVEEPIIDEPTVDTPPISEPPTPKKTKGSNPFWR